MIDLFAALTSHSPAFATVAILLTLVRLASLPQLAPQWQRFPAAWRPMVPLALALVSAALTAWLSHGWQAAIEQIAAGFPAVLYALPSPTAHLGMVILPVTAGRWIDPEPTPTIVAKPATADELAEAVLANLDKPKGNA